MNSNLFVNLQRIADNFEINDVCLPVFNKIFINSVLLL